VGGVDDRTTASVGFVKRLLHYVPCGVVNAWWRFCAKLVVPFLRLVSGIICVWKLLVTSRW